MVAPIAVPAQASVQTGAAAARVVDRLEVLAGLGVAESNPAGSTIMALNIPRFCITAAKWWSCMNTVRSS